MSWASPDVLVAFIAGLAVGLFAAGVAFAVIGWTADRRSKKEAKYRRSRPLDLNFRQHRPPADSDSSVSRRVPESTRFRIRLTKTTADGRGRPTRPSHRRVARSVPWRKVAGSRAPALLAAVLWMGGVVAYEEDLDFVAFAFVAAGLVAVFLTFLPARRSARR